MSQEFSALQRGPSIVLYRTHKTMAVSFLTAVDEAKSFLRFDETRQSHQAVCCQ